MNTYTLLLDKERSLQYSNRSFRELEKRSGIAVLTKLQDVAKGDFPSVEYITQFIYCGLLHEKISYEQVIDIIPMKRFTDILTFMVKVVTAEYGLEGESTEEEKKSTEEVLTQ